MHFRHKLLLHPVGFEPTTSKKKPHYECGAIDHSAMDAPIPNGIWDQGANFFFSEKKDLDCIKVFTLVLFRPNGANSPLKHIDFRPQTVFGHGKLRFLSQEGLPFGGRELPLVGLEPTRLLTSVPKTDTSTIPPQRLKY